MNDDLSALFAEQQANRIDWDGPLYSLYDLPSAASELSIRFLSATSRPIQGLRLKIRGGSFEVESTGAPVADDLVLWQDTAPDEVRIRITWKPTSARSLRIWNAWRVNEVTQAWLGNAGMRVRALGDGRFEFRCSDGEGDPDFDDLVAEVRLQ